MPISYQLLEKEFCPDCEGEWRCNIYDPQDCETCDGAGYFYHLELIYSKEKISTYCIK